MGYAPPAYGPPPIARRPRPRPRAGASVAFTLIGLFLALVGGLGLPWFGMGDANSVSDPALRNWGVAAFFGSQAALWVPSALVAFAGALDSIVFRVLYTVIGVLSSLTVLVLTLAVGAISMSMSRGATELTGATDGVLIGLVVVVGLVLLAWFIGFAFLRGVACRIVCGLMLLVGTAATGVAAAQFVGYSDAIVAGLGTAAFGYLLCAFAAFAGPRYEYPPYA